MPGVAETRAAIRFYGPDLDPDEVSRRLGHPATESARAGDEFPSGHVLRQGSWRLRVDPEAPGDLDGQIRAAFSLLTGDLAVWRDLTSRHRGDLFCGLLMIKGNEGLELSNEVLSLIADRGLTLGLDLYAPPDERAGAEPQLFVTDIDRAIGWYVDTLGFEEVFRYGEPVFYAQVSRDGARLNLRRSDRRPFDEGFLAHEGEVLSATITLSGIEAYSAQCGARGATFHQPLRTEDWGARTFIVKDPDGNLICFAG